MTRLLRPGEEHARCSRSALQRAARVTKTVLLGQPTAQRLQVNAIQRVDAEPAEMGEQIQQVCPVRAYSVRGQISLSPQMPQVAVQDCLELRRQHRLGHLTTLKHRNGYSKHATRYPHRRALSDQHRG